MKTITVSIVEDTRPVRQMLEEWLQCAKAFKCLSKYASAEDALEQLPSERPDIVLMDINLPGLNGIECVRRLKPLLPETQFLMLTIYEEADRIFNALSAGASGYLLKQTRREELLAALQEVHAGGAPMTGVIARKVIQAFRSPTQNNEVATLAPREREVLDLLAQGYLYKEIAEKMQICLPTVNSFIRRIYEKLHVQSRGQAVAKCARTTPFSIPQSG